MGCLYFRGKYQASKYCQFNLLGFSLLADSSLAAYLLIEEIFLRDVYQISTSSSDPLIIDAGANIGLALFYFKYWHPRAKIVAFEPQTELFSILEQNVKKNNLGDITLINGCLSGEEGTMKLFSASSRLNHTLIASLDEDRKFEIVKSYRLSDCISGQAIDLVKLDIEGAETDVIGELYEKNLLGNCAHYIIELHKAVSPPAAIDRLNRAFEKTGFRSRRIDMAVSGRENCDQVWGFERKS